MEALLAITKKVKADTAKKTGGKKYLNRKQIHQQEVERRTQEKVELQKKEAERLEAKREAEKEIFFIARKKREEEERKKASKEMKIKMPLEELIRRFRELEEPIILFGEEYKDRYLRLRKLEMERSEKESRMPGHQNELQKVLKEQTEEEITGERGDDRSAQADEELFRCSTEELAEKVLFKPYQSADCTRENYIYWFFKRLIAIYDLELQTRTTEEKISHLGRTKTAKFTQLKQFITPFFKKLIEEKLEPEVKEGFFKIVSEMQLKEYMKGSVITSSNVSNPVANDAYLELAIGNAAWPMGVTNVGIHMRQARENIFTKNTGHVLNDETQRKYFQSIKRLMTYCQNTFPTELSKTQG